MKALRQKCLGKSRVQEGDQSERGMMASGRHHGGRVKGQRSHILQHSVTGDSVGFALSGMEGSRVP